MTLTDPDRITADIVRLAGPDSGAREFARVAIETLCERAGCRAGGIRLRQEDDYPFIATQGLSASLVNAETSLCRKSIDGAVARNADGTAILECLCGSVARGIGDPAEPFFTRGGSFWTADVDGLLATPLDPRWQTEDRGRCIEEGYQSLALVPVRSGSDVCGIIHLCDKRKGRLTPETVQVLERIAEGLGPHLVERQALDALRVVETQYRALFGHMMEGFAYCQMLYDEQHHPVDWIYLAVNESFSHLTGLTDVVGKKVSRLLPTITRDSPEILEIYGAVASEGRTQRFEIFFTPLDKWLEVVAFSPERDRFVAVFSDITERKRTEEALLRTQFSVDHAADSLLWLDSDGLIVDVSESTCKRLEYSRAELIGKTIFDVDPVFPRENWREHWEEVKLNGALVFESAHRTKSGTILSQEVTSNHVNFDGQEYICSFSHEIGKRKKLEESLRLTQFSVDHAADSLMWSDSEGVILEVSESTCRTLEYSRDELIGMSVFDIDPVFPREAHSAHWERIKTQGFLAFETVHKTKSGREIPVEVTSNYMEFAGRECSCSFSHDISERKLAQQALEQSLDLFRTAFHANPVGVMLTNAESGVIRDANGSLAEISGYSRDELIGRTTTELNFLSPEDRRRFIEEMGPTGRVRDWQLVSRHKSGEARHVLLSAEVVELKGEYCVLSFIHDVTERVVSEQKLRDQQEQLRQSQKMEAVGQLAGGIAHDFNNVLTAIVGYSDLILSSDDIPMAAQEDVKEIKSAAERAGALTRQILAFSRRQALRPERTSLNQVLTNLERMLGRTLGENVELVTLLGPDLGLVEIDIAQFEQVLINLALNARDAMPLGGRLTLETANVDLGPGYCRVHPDVQPGAYVMLAVSDTGEGMDSETKSHVFEPFFTTKEAGKGTGLGLSTVYGVVNQSGGNISVYSKPGQGATFKIYLPRVHKPARAPRSTPGELPSLRGTETILVLEDEEPVRNLVTRILSSLGYKVTSTGTGQEALALLGAEDQPFDLLLSDLILPGEFQGHQVASELKTICPGLPVLFMSGYARDSIVHAGRLDEGVELLEKPFTTKILATRVRAALDQR